MSVLKQVWYVGGTKDSIEYIGTTIQENMNTKTQILHIGTDAQKIGKKTDFVTVACLHDEEARKGGRVWYTRSRMKPDMGIQEKLFQETWLSLELALSFVEQGIVPADQIMVHIDANPEKNTRGEFRWESGHYANTLASMVMGNGFKYVLKPDAWAASHGADHLVKNKHLPSTKRKRRKKGKAA